MEINIQSVFVECSWGSINGTCASLNAYIKKRRVSSQWSNKLLKRLEKVSNTGQSSSVYFKVILLGYWGYAEASRLWLLFGGTDT